MSARGLWHILCALLTGALLAFGGAGRVQAQTISTCGPATTRGTAPADFRDYCWLNFAGYNDTTARSINGQNFRFDLPDGTRISLNMRVDNLANVTNAQTALASVAVPSWTGSAFGNVAFMGIPNRPVLYNARDGSSARVRLSNITVTPPSGGTATYSMIVADGESSNGGEQLVFVTDGNAWEQVAQIPNGASTTYPTQTFSNANRTVTLNGVDGTVGSRVYRSDNNPTDVRATITGSGLQGVIFGVRYASVSVVSQFNGARYYPADQLNYLVRTTNGTVLMTGATTGTALNGFAPATVPTVAASYPFQVAQTMASGSTGTLANYTTSLTCVNANASSPTAMPVNQAVTSFQFNSLRYGDSVTCTFTSTPIFSSVGGTVYLDANRNGALDGGETGTGVSGLFIKLAPASGGVCTGPAHQAVAVTAGSGVFNVPNVPAGDYCLILDTNNTLTDITPGLPTGWTGIQNAGGSVQVLIPAGSNPEAPQFFGLYNGSRLTGSVFVDTGTSGGVANDGVRQANEAGFGGLTVTARSGATAVATAVTAGDGSFTLWLPAGSGALTIGPAQVPTGFLASGGSAGTTGGTFTRPNVAFTPANGQSYSGVAIGLVPGIDFMPNGAQAGVPGSAVFYAHTLEVGSSGQVTFTLGANAVPPLSDWTAIVYRDSNCNGMLEGSEPVLSGALAVTAGLDVCIVVKQFIPAGATLGAMNTVTVTAQFTYANANPALSVTATVTDVTTVGEPAALVLQKRVSNLTRGGGPAINVNATPGDVLLYTLTAQNQGNEPLTTLAIHDTTAAFTTYVSAACPGALPAGITACSITAQPAVGATGGVRWTLTGSLGPGAQVVVTYQVRLDQ